MKDQKDYGRASEVLPSSEGPRVAVTMTRVLETGGALETYRPLIYQDDTLVGALLASRSEAVGFHAQEAFDTHAFFAFMPCHDPKPTDLGFLNAFGLRAATRATNEEGNSNHDARSEAALKTNPENFAEGEAG